MRAHAVLRQVVPRAFPGARPRYGRRGVARRRHNAKLDVGFVVIAHYNVNRAACATGVAHLAALYRTVGRAVALHSGCPWYGTQGRDGAPEMLGVHVALFSEDVERRCAAAGRVARVVRRARVLQEFDIGVLWSDEALLEAIRRQPEPGHLEEGPKNRAIAAARVRGRRRRARHSDRVRGRTCAQAVCIDVLQGHADGVLATPSSGAVKLRRGFVGVERTGQPRRHCDLTVDNGHVIGKSRHVLGVLRERLSERILPVLRPVRRAAKVRAVRHRFVGSKARGRLPVPSAGADVVGRAKYIGNILGYQVSDLPVCEVNRGAETLGVYAARELVPEGH